MSVKQKLNEALIARGRGRPDRAARLLDDLYDKGKDLSEICPELVQTWWSSLRERKMVENFYQQLGWGWEQYHGFDHLEKGFVKKLEFPKVRSMLEPMIKKTNACEVPKMILAEEKIFYGEKPEVEYFDKRESHMAARLYIKARIYEVLGSDDDAMDHYVLAGAVEPKFSQANLRAAWYFFKMGKSSRSAELFNKAASEVDYEWHDTLEESHLPRIPRFLEKLDDGYSLFYCRGGFICCRKDAAGILREIEKVTRKFKRHFSKVQNFIESRLKKSKSKGSSIKTIKKMFFVSKRTKILRSSHSR